MRASIGMSQATTTMPIMLDTRLKNSSFINQTTNEPASRYITATYYYMSVCFQNISGNRNINYSLIRTSSFSPCTQQSPDMIHILLSSLLSFLSTTFLLWLPEHNSKCSCNENYSIRQLLKNKLFHAWCQQVHEHFAQVKRARSGSTTNKFPRVALNYQNFSGKPAHFQWNTKWSSFCS